MDLLTTLKKNNLLKFEDVRFFLLNNNLKVKDKDDLYIVIYDKLKSDLTKKFIKQSRGIILEKETNNIICYTFDNNKDFDYEEKQDINLDDTIIEESIDGTQIRLFYYKNKWNVATTRCIDAYKAYWKSNKSFGELFDDVKTKINFDKLNTDYCYSFVLRHKNNRIVVNYKENDLILVCVRNLKTLEEVDKIEEGKRLEIKLPKVIEEFKDFDELVNYCRTDNKLNEEGFMLYNKKTGDRMKIIKKKYEEIKKLLYNSNALIYRYYLLRMNKQLEEYLKYYPEDCVDFVLFEYRTKEIIQGIHTSYMNLNVNKCITMKDIEFPYRPLVYKLHGLYLNRTYPKITKKVVETEYNKLHAKQHTFMYNLIYTTYNNNE